MTDHAPQTAGKVKINYTPGQAAEISIDGYRLEQHVTALRLELDANEKPKLILELLPSSVELVANDVKVTVRPAE